MSQTQLKPGRVAPADARRAPVDHPVHDLIAARWSPRAFAPTPVEEEKLRGVFEAARWGASSSNVQPWRFLVARRGDASFDRLRALLSGGNKAWTENVPVLVLCVTDTVFPATGDKPARENPTAKHDLGWATAHLALQATELGLHVHPMAGFDNAGAKEAFGVPAPYEPVTVLAVGYLAPSSTLPDDLRAREEAPRVRKALREIVFEDGWGDPASFT